MIDYLNKLFRPNKVAQVLPAIYGEMETYESKNDGDAAYRAGYYFESLLNRTLWYCHAVDIEKSQGTYTMLNVLTGQSWEIAHGTVWAERFYPNGATDKPPLPLRPISAHEARTKFAQHVHTQAVQSLRTRIPFLYHALVGLRLIERLPVTRYEEVSDFREIANRKALWLTNSTNENLEFFEKRLTRGLGVDLMYSVRGADGEREHAFVLKCMGRDVPCLVTGNVLTSLLNNRKFSAQVMRGDIRILTDEYAMHLINDPEIICLVTDRDDATNYPWARKSYKYGRAPEIVKQPEIYTDRWYARPPSVTVHENLDADADDQDDDEDEEDQACAECDHFIDECKCTRKDS